MKFLFILPLAGLAPMAASSHGAPYSLDIPIAKSSFQDLRSRDACDPSPENWELYEVDQKLQANWNPSSGIQFDDWIFSNFGPKTRNAECGIDKNACILPDCSDYPEDELWAYLVRHSLVRMSQLLSVIAKSIDQTQMNLNSIPQSIAKDLFPWPDGSHVNLQAAEIWTVAAITAMLATVVFLPALFPVLSASAAGAISSAATGFAVAGASYIEDTDAAVIQIIQLLTNTGQVGQMIKERQDRQRTSLEKFSRALMSGGNVANGETIVNYLVGGRFTIDPGVEQEVLNQFNFEMWISPLVNQVWKDKTKSFVMCAPVSAGPIPCNDATFYNSSDVSCCIYNLQDDNSYKYPPKLEILRDSPYDINLTHITESSYNSYDTGGFSFDMFNMTSNIAGVVPEGYTNQFLTMGSRYQGIWTLPVCVVPDASWVAPFDQKMLPCCCGPHCSETNTFFKVANIDKDEIQDVCRKQYPEAWPQGNSTSSLFSKRADMLLGLALLGSIWFLF